MYETVSYKDTLNETEKIYVDVRTPKEFQKETIPGAINLPVLYDEERAVVGTLYKQKSPEEAKLAGVQFISKRLPEIFSQYQKLFNQYKKVYVFCSRGGYRSSSIVSFIYSLGIHIYKLDGGYKFYRQFVREELEKEIQRITPVVLYGNTGSGKTKILKELEKKGYPVMDLEGMANHRGSLLGAVGLGQQNSQKMFESYLYEGLLKGNPYLFMEGESRKIGQVALPKLLYEKMPEGISIKIESPMSYRVKNLVEEYLLSPSDNGKGEYSKALMEEELSRALEQIKRYFPKEKIEEYKIQIKKGNYEFVAEELCRYYYDPRYQTRIEDYDYVFENADEIQCAEDILSKLGFLFQTKDKNPES